MYKPQLSYYHPNVKGSGSAIAFEVNPALKDAPGCVFVSIAPQKTVATGSGTNRTFATFDWSRKIILKLDIDDLSQILMVFRGVQESILDGKGLYHASAKGNAIIRLEHRFEPACGYSFEVSKKTPEDSDIRRLSIFLSPVEAFGLSIALEQILGLVAFGIPAYPPEAVDGTDWNIQDSRKDSTL